MNVSQPVPSAIDSVDFSFLSSAEIKTLSVKRIQNPLTFDTLLNPVPGGLYDLALGAWGDNAYAELLRVAFKLLTRLTAALPAIWPPSRAPAIQAISTCQYLYIILHLWTKFYGYFERNANTATISKCPGKRSIDISANSG